MAIIKDVLYNEGEGLEQGDLNAAQRYQEAYSADFIVADTAHQTETEGYHIYDPTELYSRWGECRVKIGGLHPIGTDFRITPGMLYQTPTGATLTGADPGLLSYYVSSGEIALPIPSNSSGFGRWDILCAKLSIANDTPVTRDFKDATTGLVTSTSMSVRRSVTLTTSYVQGTPSGSPVEPAVPSGYAKWFRFKVPNGWTTGGTFNRSNVFEFRWPLGFKTITTVSGSCLYNPSDWSINTAGGLTSIGSPKVFYALPTSLGAHATARLRRIAVSYDSNGSSSSPIFKLARIDLKDPLGAINYVRTITSDLGSVTTAKNWLTWTLDNSVEGIWGAGNFQSDPESFPSSDPNRHILALEVTANDTTVSVYSVQWDFAGGF